ncbi:hypothetical protein CFOL_v3_20696 [Cephalotus follicularis]|uniref:Uncharacterized protein n=1 Tax=Cephalotus follicularis TaxID=3775 RepID=A0A1Q3CAI2_CEPFO|nr:hypothetical protein CFOL_v3_20696 [Cephalotus follicularis]
MDQVFLSFIFNNTEQPVPFPWERVYDLRTETLYYINQLTGLRVIDLRPQVNLGGGLMHSETLWSDFMNLYRLNFGENPYRYNHPFILAANCLSPPAYLIVNEPVQRCPMCFDHFILSHP